MSVDKSKNHFDEKGNYVNVENLTLRQIFEQGFDTGYKRGYIDGALHKDESIPATADYLFDKIMKGDFNANP